MFGIGDLIVAFFGGLALTIAFYSFFEGKKMFGSYALISGIVYIAILIYRGWEKWNVIMQ